MLEVRIGRVEHHADEGDGLERRLQARHVFAQTPDVIRLGQDGAANGSAARHIGVVVRVERGDELHRGLTLEEVHHLGALIQEGRHRRFVVIRAGLLHHVGAHRVQRVLGVLLAAMGVQGHPQHAARKRRGAAKHGFFLDHHHIQSPLFGGDGAGQSCSTRAHHQQVTCHRVCHLGFLKRFGCSQGAAPCPSTCRTCRHRPPTRRR